MWETNRHDLAGKLQGHPMANPQASVETCRPQAGVAEHSLIRASTTAHDGCVASGQIRYLQPVRSCLRDTEPVRIPQSGRARGALSGASERRRIERDLNGELVLLIVKRAVAQLAPETPPALAHTLAAIEARAQAALDWSGTSPAGSTGRCSPTSASELRQCMLRHA